MQPLLQKVIIWLLTALIAIMTAIGGSTASRLITQLDEATDKINDIQTNLAVEREHRQDVELRIQKIEESLLQLEESKEK